MATKLKSILFKKNISQKELAVMIIKDNNGKNVSQATLCNIINGKQQNYMLDTLRAICKALKVTPNEILDWVDVRNENKQTN